MDLLLEKYLQKIKDLTRKHKDLKINSLEVDPKIHNQIVFDIGVYDNKEWNDYINTIFGFFIGAYIYRKMDNQIKHYEKQLKYKKVKSNDEEDEYRTMYEIAKNTYPDFDIRYVEEARNRNKMIIDYKHIETDFLTLELSSPGKNNGEILLLHNVIRQQSNQIPQLYFYSCQTMVNWMAKNNIEYNEPERWGEFFMLDIGW